MSTPETMDAELDQQLTVAETRVTAAENTALAAKEASEAGRVDLQATQTLVDQAFARADAGENVDGLELAGLRESLNLRKRAQAALDAQLSTAVTEMAKATAERDQIRARKELRALADTLTFPDLDALADKAIKALETFTAACTKQDEVLPELRTFIAENKVTYNYEESGDGSPTPESPHHIAIRGKQYAYSSQDDRRKAKADIARTLGIAPGQTWI